MTNPYRQALEDIANLAEKHLYTWERWSKSLKIATSALETPEVPSCVDPNAAPQTCANCLEEVHTCERAEPVDGDYRCPAHPDGEEMSNGDWVCSEECGRERQITQLEQQIATIREAAERVRGLPYTHPVLSSLLALIFGVARSLPEVAGDTLTLSLGDFERRCLLLLAEEQEKPLPANTLVAILCEAVRLGREHLDLLRKPIAAIEGSSPTVLEGVFDHAPGCRAPDYGECSCKPAPRDAEIAHQTRNSAVLADFTAYCQQYPEQRFWQALRNWSGACQIIWVDWAGPQTETRDTFHWEGKAHKVVAESGEALK